MRLTLYLLYDAKIARIIFCFEKTDKKRLSQKTSNYGTGNRQKQYKCIIIIFNEQ